MSLNHELIATLEQSQALLLRLLESPAVVRAISWETVGEMQEVYQRQLRVLTQLKQEGSPCPSTKT
jgi:hypothetical protein